MMAGDKRTFFIVGKRLFISRLIEPDRYSRMPGITICKSVVNDAPGYEMTYRGEQGRLVYKIGHGTLDDMDIVMGLSYFARNEVSKSLNPYHCKLMREAVEILRQNRHVRKEKMYNENVYDLIEAADACRKEIVLCLLGKPGIGKTEAVEKFAKDHGRNVVHIITSQILPSEVSGMTMPNQETKSMDVFDHYRLSHMKDGDILFFDELLKGQQQVLNACLTLIQERRLMSGTKLPDVLIIAAANPLASPAQLPLEIRQRFMFVEVEWDRGEWIEYMKRLGFNNEEGLYKLADKIMSKEDSTKEWNTLTPRTATKLCIWMRETSRPMVKWYIDTEFGSDVSSIISDIVLDKVRKSPKMQIADKIIEELAEKNADPDSQIMSDERVVAIEMAQDIVEGKEQNLSELVDILIKLPEWDKIKEVLSNTKIENDIEF